jgi:hypothetical protein
MRHVPDAHGAIFCRLIWSSDDGLGYHQHVSNGNGAVALMLTVAALTGMSHLHGSPVRRHATDRNWSSPERAELGDVRIPVRTVRRHSTRERPRDLAVGRVDEATPEVIVGYVDPARGSTAFHRLTRVVEGDRLKVVRHDRRVDWYKVDSIRQAVRRNIDRERSSTGRPELRLISWRGTRNSHNIVVSAHLDRPARPLQTDEVSPALPDDLSR